MNTGNKSHTVVCPDCREKFTLKTQPFLKQRITCPNCWAYLEVVNLNPLRLEWDTIEEEDEELWEE